MKQIILKISPDGLIQAETVNMKGHECQKYVSSIEEITSAISVDSKYKESFYQHNDKLLNEGISDISEEVISSKMNV